MTDSELDTAYTRLCTTLTQLGEAQAQLYLARFALLAITQLGDATVVHRLIAAAAKGLHSGDEPHSQAGSPNPP